MKSRNIERRRQREFRKLVTEHSLLITLYKNDEIVKHMSEIESVLWDFYMAGVFDSLKTMAIAMNETYDRAKQNE